MTRLRQALNDDTGQAYVETVPKKGYRFVATVREVVPEAPPAHPPTEPSRRRCQCADRHSHARPDGSGRRLRSQLLPFWPEPPSYFARNRTMPPVPCNRLS